MDFKFGLEAEYILQDKTTKNNLWWSEINFKILLEHLENINYEGSIEGLTLEDGHNLISPYIIEGYHQKNEKGEITGMQVKGVEIRTPIENSIQATSITFRSLFQNLTDHLSKLNYQLLALSHHPVEYEFDGPQYNRRYDFWKWALEVMTTYGPDINISFPKQITEKLFKNKKSFERKINYYAPSLCALSLSSPFARNNLLKNSAGEIVKSVRTFRRSIYAPAIEWHADEAFRIEFKFFEMPTSIKEFEAYFLLCLTLAIDDGLDKEASDQERIYRLGEVSINGLEGDEIKKRAFIVLAKASQLALEFGIKKSSLDFLYERLEKSTTPADEMIKRFQEGAGIKEILAKRTGLLENYK
jgi:hypothetical protein